MERPSSGDRTFPRCSKVRKTVTLLPASGSTKLSRSPSTEVSVRRGTERYPCAGHERPRRS
jgi:hypothetical protein